MYLGTVRSLLRSGRRPKGHKDRVRRVLRPCGQSVGNAGLVGGDNDAVMDSIIEAPRAHVTALLRGVALAWESFGERELADECRRSADEVETGAGAVMVAEVTYVVIENASARS